MFFILSKILAFLIRPIVWVFLMLIIAVLLKKSRKKILLLSVFTFWFFSNTFICDEISSLWEHETFSIENIQTKYDVGVVLGGMSAFDSKTNTVNFNKNADRLIYTEKLYRKGIINKILISGGSGMLIKNQYKEAFIMRNHLIENGIPDDDIIIENKSRNTKENAFLSAEILKRDFQNKSVLLITSALHMKRAIFCFEKAGIEVASFSTDNTNSNRNLQLEYLLLPNSKSFEKWESIIHEWVGYLVYKIVF
ncbi:MAG: hypothetical protein CBC83_03480 [Flavobacteriales bacterium TMED123]|nr:MAG: hypothetical protein CBC83_03480 [Flavobacteriales bacterium TMED123]|tara:strand:+ start:6542 stop:7294 length:753 start_codon:yes stop_codon:yes gene_type:complete